MFNMSVFAVFVCIVCEIHYLDPTTAFEKDKNKNKVYSR